MPFRLAYPLSHGPELWLAYGDPLVGEPPWSLERHATFIAEFARASLGGESPNPFHQPPSFGLEWMKRRPQVLTGLMLFILMLLLVLVLRSRSSGAERSSPG